MPGEGAPPEREYDLAADPRALRARIRSELMDLVRAISQRRYDEAAAAIHPSAADGKWGAAQIEAAVEPFYAEFERMVFDPRARQAHLCVITERAPRLWDIHQVLLDDQDENQWNVEGEVDLREERNPSKPLLRLRRIGE
jgi:hypothetical protein